MMEILASPYFGIFLLPIAIWELVWKGIALWKAARSRHIRWFVIILLLNTLGILPIVYILFFNKAKKRTK